MTADADCREIEDEPIAVEANGRDWQTQAFGDVNKLQQFHASDAIRAAEGNKGQSGGKYLRPTVWMTFSARSYTLMA